MADSTPNPKEQAIAAAKLAIESLFKGLKYTDTTGKSQGELKKQLEEQLLRALDKDAAKQLTNEDLKKVIDDVITKGSGKAYDDKEIRNRTDLLKGTEATITEMKGLRDRLSSNVDTLLAEYKEGSFPGIDQTKPAKKLQIMDALRTKIPEVLNGSGDDDYDVLKDQIEAVLKKTTQGELPGNVKAQAKIMADDIWNTSTAMETETKKLLDQINTVGTNDVPRKLTQEEKDKIIADIHSKLWPEMMRESITDRKAMFESILADGIRSHANLDEKAQKELAEKTKSTAKAIDAYVVNAGVSMPTTSKFIIDTVKQSVGSGSGDLHLSSGTAIGAGVGAAIGLGVGSTDSALGVIKGLSALGFGVVVGAAYDNGLFDVKKQTGLPVVKDTKDPKATTVQK